MWTSVQNNGRTKGQFWPVELLWINKDLTSKSLSNSHEEGMNGQDIAAHVQRWRKKQGRKSAKKPLLLEHEGLVGWRSKEVVGSTNSGLTREPDQGMVHLPHCYWDGEICDCYGEKSDALLRQRPVVSRVDSYGSMCVELTPETHRVMQ